MWNVSSSAAGSGVEWKRFSPRRAPSSAEELQKTEVTTVVRRTILIFILMLEWADERVLEEQVRQMRWEAIRLPTPRVFCENAFGAEAIASKTWSWKMRRNLVHDYIRKMIPGHS